MSEATERRAKLDNRGSSRKVVRPDFLSALLQIDPYKLELSVS